MPSALGLCNVYSSTIKDCLKTIYYGGVDILLYPYSVQAECSCRRSFYELLIELDDTLISLWDIFYPINRSPIIDLLIFFCNQPDFKFRLQTHRSLRSNC